MGKRNKAAVLNRMRRRLRLTPITTKGKMMRKTLGVSLLVLLLTGSASAGIMPNLPPAPPPSQQTNATQEPTNTAQEPTSDGIIPKGAAESLTQTVLDLLAVLPSLL